MPDEIAGDVPRAAHAKAAPFRAVEPPWVWRGDHGAGGLPGNRYGGAIMLHCGSPGFRGVPL
ncbi:MAG: hypothetical protein EKK55_07035 [Rhodocyclaceae bacterium]|nr:MAG: hypothetical protein EKK55_07035 [Rhodocyclaceae bacterium]